MSGPWLAATTAGVWISVRPGMMGGVSEASSDGLKAIAPASSYEDTNVYHQAMGFSVDVSDGVLWLGNVLNGFQCADPETGAIRATEAMPIAFFEDPYALDHVVYAFDGSDLVAISPPAVCFG